MTFAQQWLTWTNLSKTYPAIAYSIFFKCFKLDGPHYISQFFTPRLTKYNLRECGLYVVQSPYNSLIMHNSCLYMITHIWNQLPAVIKSSSTLAQFRARLNNVDFTGCRCMIMNCIQFYLFLQIFNIRTSFPQESFIIYSKFILAHIVILSSNVIY